MSLSTFSLGEPAIAEPTQRLRQLLNYGPVTLQPIDRDLDGCGRKLRIFVVDGANVGDTLVGEGLPASTIAAADPGANACRPSYRCLLGDYMSQVNIPVAMAKPLKKWWTH